MDRRGCESRLKRKSRQDYKVSGRWSLSAKEFLGKCRDDTGRRRRMMKQTVAS